MDVVKGEGKVRFKKRIGLERRTARIGYLLMVPALLVVFVFIFYPIAFSFWLSLNRLNLNTMETTWRGLSNYITVLNSSKFQDSVVRTFYFTFLSVAGATFGALCVALVLNETFIGRGWVRSFVLIPWAIPPIIVGLMWKWIFDGSYGAFNGLLYQFGLIDEYVLWLAKGDLTIHAVAFANVWRNIAFSTILQLAALQAIPEELYDAAKVEGANAAQRFRHVTLVWMKPTILITLILNTLFALRIFDEIYIMTRGGPGEATTFISWLVYLQSFTYLKFDFGNAAAYILGLISIGIAFFYIKLVYDPRKGFY